MQNNFNVEISSTAHIKSAPASREITRINEKHLNTDSFSEQLNIATHNKQPLPSADKSKLTDLREWLSETFIDDACWADRAAYLYGCEYIETPLLSINEWPTVRIAATGELYTADKAIYFKQLADRYHEERVQLYRNEIAQGTPPLEIIDKIFNYNRTLPEEFQKMSGWL